MTTPFKSARRKRVRAIHAQEMRKKREAMSETECVHISRAVTEAVCAQFMDWQGQAGTPAPFDLKADIFQRVCKVLTDGVEI